jgi:hypothetical protein
MLSKGRKASYMNSMEKRLKVQSGAPIGATCHYERQNDGWYVVWGEDFEAGGKKKVSDEQAWYLECGYQIGRQDAS